MPTDEEMRRAMEADVAKELESLNNPEQRKLDEEFDSKVPDTATEVVENESKENDGDSGGGTDAKPQAPRIIAEKLKSLGYDVDDETTDEELTESLISRLAKIEQAAKEADRKAQEAERRLQELASKKPDPVVEKPADKPPEDKPKRKLPPALVRPDTALEALVEWDDETRMFVGKDRFGSIAIEAAKQFNDYRAARAKREQELIDNPESLFTGFGEDIEERLSAKAEALIEARLKARLEEIERQQMETSTKTAAQRTEEEFESFMGSVKDKLYRLNSDGSVRKTLDDEPAWTDAGKLFRDEYNALYEFNPSASPVAIAKRAYERVAKIASLAPAKSPEDKAAEKKRNFVTKGRKHETGVPSSQNSATVTDKFNSGNNASLLEALLQDEANDDNPDLASYRK